MALLDQALSRYVDFTWRHLRMEEQELMPFAELYLSTSNWMTSQMLLQAIKTPWRRNRPKAFSSTSGISSTARQRLWVSVETEF
jgi:hypothetical protein